MKYIKKYKLFESDDNNQKTKEWFYAIKMQNITKLSLMLQGGFDINEKDDVGRTGLIYACDYSKFDSAFFLLKQKNININALTIWGHCALSNVCQSPYYIEVCNFINDLFTHPDLDVNGGIRTTGLLEAAYESNIKAVKILLEHPKIDALRQTDGKIEDDGISHNFIEYLINNGQTQELIDLDLQKIIIKNNEHNISIFFKYHLEHPEIRKKFPHLASGSELNLL